MRISLFAGTAVLGLVALTAPASAMPVAKMAPVVSSKAGVVPVYHRRYYGARRHYRPRYVYRSYDYDDSYPVVAPIDMAATAGSVLRRIWLRLRIRWWIWRWLRIRRWAEHRIQLRWLLNQIIDRPAISRTRRFDGVCFDCQHADCGAFSS